MDNEAQSQDKPSTEKKNEGVGECKESDVEIETIEDEDMGAEECVEIVDEIRGGESNDIVSDEEPVEIDDIFNSENMNLEGSYMESVRNMTDNTKIKSNTDYDLINISSDEENSVNNLNVQKKKKRKLTMLNLPHGISIKRVKRDGMHLSPPYKRSKKMIPNNFIPEVSFKFIGGTTKTQEMVNELISLIKDGGVYAALGTTPPRGYLLHGPPGSGKTLLVQAIAGEIGVPLIQLHGPELVTRIYGDIREHIRDMFCRAVENAPCILSIDELDKICTYNKNNYSDELKQKIVLELISSIDGLNEDDVGNGIVIIGTTSEPDLVDPEFRRIGRLDREIPMGMPDRNDRLEILKVLTDKMEVRPEVDLEALAASTVGFVGTDLKYLTSLAAILAVNRHTKCMADRIKGMETKNRVERSERVNNLPEEVIDVDISCEDSSISLKSRGFPISRDKIENFIEMIDFMNALKSMKPSSRSEGFITVPDVTWDDIGSLRDIKKQLNLYITMPLKEPKMYSLLGISLPKGILLWGPSGCGKTMIAKAAANEANINFISVRGPELLDMYAGESDRAVRQCFQRAQNSQPCLIFFDEIDMVCSRATTVQGNNESHKIFNQILIEMDRLDTGSGMFVLAAVNRPDILDSALLKPGRFDKLIYVGVPSADDRADILKTITKVKPPMKNVDFDIIGKDPSFNGYTGADLAALVREASLIAFSKYVEHKNEKETFVTEDMLHEAASKNRPSLLLTEIAEYEKLKTIYSSPEKSLPNGVV